MPDWFYHPVAKPVFSCLPDILARGIALSVIGSLARFSMGRGLIDFLGHMRPSKDLSCDIAGRDCSSRVGMGRWLDPSDCATQAFDRFGFGLIELGPFAELEGSTDSLKKHSLGIEVCSERLRSYVTYKRPPCDAAIMLALNGSFDECQKMVNHLDGHCDYFIIDCDAALVTETPIFRNIIITEKELFSAADQEVNLEDFAGIRLQFLSDTAVIPHTLSQAQIDIITSWRSRLSDEQSLLVAGGGLEPAKAVELIEAGADLLMIDSAMLHAGPSLCKRINDGLQALPECENSVSVAAPAETTRYSWFWVLMLGIGMFVGGLLTTAIALTNVLLPYDEHYLGMTAADLHFLHDRLLAFMAHDRICLSGSMLGLGIVYIYLALYGVRHGSRHAMFAVEASGLIGFFTFFYFIGFGYFDPLHAFVSAVLCQVILIAMVAKRSPLRSNGVQDLCNDAAWKRSQFGQLFMLIHCAGLLGAGMLISGIGMGEVFVAEDLDFMQCSAKDVLGINPRLLNVVAHDRASLGGMLLSCGVANLFMVLRLWKRGAAWLWTCFALMGLFAYVSGIGIHFAVGYTHWLHLTPAFAGAGLLLVGLICSRSFLFSR